MKKYILLAIVGLLLMSCFEDKGNYSYTVGEQITVSGVEKEYLRYFMNDRLVVRPEVCSTDPDARFEYLWTISAQRMLQGRTAQCRMRHRAGIHTCRQQDFIELIVY